MSGYCWTILKEGTIKVLYVLSLSDAGEVALEALQCPRDDPLKSLIYYVDHEGKDEKVFLA